MSLRASLKEVSAIVYFYHFNATMNTIRCNVAVSQDVVKEHILELAVEQTKAANVNVCEMELDAMVDEALAWARLY